MDSVSRLLMATYPPNLVEYSKTVRFQALFLIVTSAFGVMVSVVNFSASPYYNIIAGSFFMASSLLGVPVAMYAYKASRKLKSPYVGRYKRLIFGYAFVYSVLLVASIVLEFFTVAEGTDDQTLDIVLGVAFLVLLVLVIPTCVCLVKSGYRFYEMVERYESSSSGGGGTNPTVLQKNSQLILL